MDRKLYMSVDPMCDREDAVPAKRLDESFLGKTFKEALDYIRSEQTDELNQDPYNSIERYGLAKINEIMLSIDNGTKPLEKSGISFKCETQSKSYIPVSLDDTISEYADQILLERQGRYDAQDIPYNLIAMSINQVYGGGSK